MKNEFYDQIHKLLEEYLEEINFLIDSGRFRLAFLVMSQIIELLGALLDDKPLRAKEQSKKRFNLALKKLFPDKYFYSNEKDFLYLNYRCNMSHLLIASNLLTITSISQMAAQDHLTKINDKIVLVAEILFIDIENACNKLLNKIERGEIINKKGFQI